MVFLLPVPDQARELLTAEVMSRLLLLPPKRLLDNGLGRNTSVVAARNPQSGKAPKAVSIDLTSTCFQITNLILCHLIRVSCREFARA